MEHSNGVGAASHARNDGVGKPAHLLQHLRARLRADDGLQSGQY